MLPELHAINALFYAESRGNFKSRNKMAVTPFDPQSSKNPCYKQTSRRCIL